MDTRKEQVIRWTNRMHKLEQKLHARSEGNLALIATDLRTWGCALMGEASEPAAEGEPAKQPAPAEGDEVLRAYLEAPPQEVALDFKLRLAVDELCRRALR